MKDQKRRPACIPGNSKSGLTFYQNAKKMSSDLWKSDLGYGKGNFSLMSVMDEMVPQKDVKRIDKNKFKGFDD